MQKPIEDVKPGDKMTTSNLTKEESKELRENVANIREVIDRATVPEWLQRIVNKSRD